MNSVNLLHIPKNSASFYSGNPSLPGSGLLWETCLRKIYVSGEPLPSERGPFETYSAEQAYGFLLEVICGLRSPLLGETEVMGQFKTFLSEAQAQFDPSLRRFFEKVWADAKTIRSQFLRNTGSQSYGSITRRHLQELSSIAILGSGQLATEIVPWLIKKPELFILARRPDRAQAIKEKYPQVLIRNLDDKVPQIDALVIAAPVENSWLKSWIEQQELAASIKKIIDLRGEEQFTPLNSQHDILLLPEIFAELDKSKSQAELQVARARQEISILVKKFSDSTDVRPYGWDDVCY